MAAAAARGGSPSLSAGEEEPPLGLDSLVEEAAAAAPSAGFRLTAVRREPAVRLQHGVSGLEPLAWSEDHRVSVSTARSIAVLEQLSDVHSGGQEMVIHRTAVPAPSAACLLKVSRPRRRRRAPAASPSLNSAGPGAATLRVLHPRAAGEPPGVAFPLPAAPGWSCPRGRFAAAHAVLFPALVYFKSVGGGGGGKYK